MCNLPCSRACAFCWRVQIFLFFFFKIFKNKLKKLNGLQNALTYMRYGLVKFDIHTMYTQYIKQSACIRKEKIKENC